jgi:hypothetical protein
MPMVRKIYPNLLAAELCSVQPMQTSTASIFSMKWNYDYTAEYTKMLSVVGDLTQIVSVHAAIRKFMSANLDEPNIYFRPWLEQHVGEQGIDWQWVLHPSNFNELVIYFKDKDTAILFELTWQ